MRDTNPEHFVRVMVPAPEKIWCDHCNTFLKTAAVRGCLRPSCKTKGFLA